MEHYPVIFTRFDGARASASLQLDSHVMITPSSTLLVPSFLRVSVAALLHPSLEKGVILPYASSSPTAMLCAPSSVAWLPLFSVLLGGAAAALSSHVTDPPALSLQADAMGALINVSLRGNVVMQGAPPAFHVSGRWHVADVGGGCGKRNSSVCT